MAHRKTGMEFGNSNSNVYEKFPHLSMLKMFAENAEIGGLRQISRSKEYIRIIFWFLILLGGAAALTYQTYLAVIKYNQHSRNTKVSLDRKQSLEFPAVTICNQNPYDYYKLKSFQPQIASYLQGVAPSTNSNSQSSGQPNNQNVSQSGGQSGSQGSSTSSTQSGSSQRAPPNINNMGSRSADTTYQNLLTFQSMIASLNKEDITNIGYSASDMIASCYINNYQCNASDFNTISNSQYGNCFIFNSLNNSLPWNASEVGPMFGLKLILFLNTSTYLPTTENIGVRLLVHHREEYPFPEYVGFNAGPGRLTSVALQKIIRSTIIPPEGDCTVFSTDQLSYYCAYTGLIPNANYSQRGCINTCIQRLTVSNCSCFNPWIPFRDSPTSFRDFGVSSIRQCNTSITSGDSYCMGYITMGLYNGTFSCANCTVPCTTYSYDINLSECSWPSVFEQIKITNMLNSMPAMSKTMTQQNQSITSLIQSDLVKVEIYYQTMTVTQYSDEIAYELVNLMSDFGGLMGLWLALSVVHFAELLELIIDLFLGTVMCAYLKHREQSSKKKAALPFESGTKNAW